MHACTMYATMYIHDIATAVYLSQNKTRVVMENWLVLSNWLTCNYCNNDQQQVEIPSGLSTLPLWHFDDFFLVIQAVFLRFELWAININFICMTSYKEKGVNLWHWLATCSWLTLMQWPGLPYYHWSRIRIRFRRYSVTDTRLLWACSCSTVWTQRRLLLSSYSRYPAASNIVLL